MDHIRIIVNGEERPAEPGLSLLDLIRQLALEPSRVAVELDRSIVQRDQWATTPVLDGARLEIVQFVGGG